LESAEIYDPIAGSWTATGSMTTGRILHTASLLQNGTVLAAGGYYDPSTGSPLASAEIYKPVAGTWTATVSMTTARAEHTAILLPNGVVLEAGGINAGNILSGAEIYDSP
jgi:hypothetical protein